MKKKEDKDKLTFKIITLGESGVGKTFNKKICL